MEESCRFHAPVALPPWANTRYPWKRRQEGLQRRSRCLGEEKNLTTKNSSIFQKEVYVGGGGGGGFQEDFISDVYKKGPKEKRKIVYKTQMPIVNTDISFL
jgi:hypothetical protein